MNMEILLVSSREGGGEEEEEIERPPSVGRVGYTSLSSYRVFSLSRRARRSSSQGWEVINNDLRSNVLINIGSIIVIFLRVMKRNLVWVIFFIALFVFNLFDLFVDNCNEYLVLEEGCFVIVLQLCRKYLFS